MSEDAVGWMLQGEQCPNCGNKEAWYRDARLDPVQLLIEALGGPKATSVVPSISGGHCLSCNHEEEAVYADAEEGGK